MMKRIRNWLLRLFGKQSEPAPEPAPRRDEGKMEVEPRNKTIGREKQIIAEGVEQFFNDNYELRFNILKQAEEFRPRLPEKAAGFEQKAPGFDENVAVYDCPTPWDNSGWLPLTDRELRRIAFEQMKEVGVAWSIDIELYARSTVVPDYNPVADFLSHCTPWDGTTDHIGALARRVPTGFNDWPLYFHRWLLGMVAQWQQRSRDYGNSLVPMLIGGQGTHKSTFCKLLLPREQAKIKRVLTERDVQTRRMRSDQYLMLPRMASFIATTNEREPLTDPTGSRRYLCCELTGTIDTTSPIDHAALYGQAVAELDAGMPWYLNRDEEAALEQHNQQYRQPVMAEELLLAWFEPAPRKKDNLMKATAIQEVLRQHIPAADVPNLKQLTIALRQCRFPRGAVHGVHGWYVTSR